MKVLQKEVKAKWNVDAYVSSLYKVRKKAQQKIYEKLDKLYHQLWDYCAMVRKTNIGSYLIIMVKRPMPAIPCRFKEVICIICSNEN